jgi:hypothetical protein
MAINSFVSSSVVDGTSVLSNMDLDVLVALIQQHPDPYFDTTSEVKQVYVYYSSDDTRQFQYALFEGNPMTGTFGWGQGAKDGTWSKSKVVVLGDNNAKNTLYNISGESLVHSDSTMFLNI